VTKYEMSTPAYLVRHTAEEHPAWLEVLDIRL
jgi:hypothetical protein